MHGFRLSPALQLSRVGSLGFGLLLLALIGLDGTPVVAQDRSIISSEVAVSGGESSLHLSFQDDETLEIEFKDGSVYIDGQDLGSYERGDALESSWRSLLGRAVSLSDDALAEALRSWSPPEGGSDLGGRIDRALESALSAPAQDTDEDTDVDVSVSGDLDLGLLSSLLGRTDRFIALAEALEDLDLDYGDLSDETIQVHLNEPVTIEEGERLDASLILIDSDLDVQGHLAGNAILLGGSLEIGEDARVDGEVHLSDTRVVNNGGVVAGGINRLRLEREVVDSERFNEMRDEIRDELRREIRASVPNGRGRDRSDGVLDAFRHVGRGVSGMMQNLFAFAFIAVLAFAVVRFFGGNLEVVAEAARANPTRAGVVGVAGAFLLLPVWILGIVALCISLIGIPVLLAWIPLFPVAALLAGGLGFLAVAGNIGEWASRQNMQGFDWVRPSNPLSVVLAGVAALILPFFAANFIQMAGPWLAFVRGLLTFVGSVAIFLTMAVGFGAVLLTRGGRRREWAMPDDLDGIEWDEEFRTATKTAEPVNDDGPSAAAAAEAEGDASQSGTEDDEDA